MLNPFQRACAAVYSAGDFGHVQDIEQARAMHDPLFTFLMIELSSPEGCDGRNEAIRRLDMTIADIEQVADAIRQGDESIDDEPDRCASSSSEIVTLQFRPQAWVNDYAVSVDIEHPDRWTVPLPLLLERFPTEQDWRDRDEDRDQMRHEGDSPTWLRDWTGPFEIDVADGEDPWSRAAAE